MSSKWVIRKPLVTQGNLWEQRQLWRSQALGGNGGRVGKKAFRKNMYESTLLGMSNEGMTLEGGFWVPAIRPLQGLKSAC